MHVKELISSSSGYKDTSAQAARMSIAEFLAWHLRHPSESVPEPLVLHIREIRVNIDTGSHSLT